MNSFEKIHTEKLLLIRPTESDFIRYFQINGDPKTNMYNPYGPMNHEIAQESFQHVLDHWEEHDFGIWSIREVLKSEYVIGFGGISNRMYGDDLRINLGFRFDSAFWGKGYATELAFSAIKNGFNLLHINEIFGLVRPNNFASIRVLEKSKMLRYGDINDIPNEKPSFLYRITSNQYNSMI